MFRLIRQSQCSASRGIRYASTVTEPIPPLLSKFRDDLKAAMRSKQKPRLKVIRSILADVTNASKGPSPITTDAQMLSLLRKQIASSEKASEEFAQAQRDDLKTKQDEEITLMKEYASQVKTVSDEDVARAIEHTYQDLNAAGNANLGRMLRGLLSEGGNLAGKPVDKAEVARLVQEMLKKKA